MPTGPAASVEVLYGPVLQLTESGIRMRFETQTEDPLPVYEGTDCPAAITPTTDTVERTYRWPDIDGQLGLDHPDAPGRYTQHEVLWTDLAPGEWVSWSIPTGPGADELLEGTFRAPPTKGQAFRVAFVGDTMSPMKETVLPLMATYEPDVFLHGGDIQYMSFPGDTWSAFFLAGRELMGNALSTFCLGNHEYEGQDEETVLYDRFFGGQGNVADGTAEWHATDYAGVRFVSLSSEAPMSDAADAQLVWLEAVLSEVDASADLDQAVVFFHRPIYTLAHHEPRLAARAAIDAVLDRHDVPLVLTGHNHSYERFLVDGVTYVVDGGGGALLYDVDTNVEAYPEDAALRQAWDKSFGFTLLDVEGSSIRLSRMDENGELIDEAEIQAR